MWLRQVKRYFRSRSRIIGSLAQPILFLVALGFGFGPVFAKAGSGDYMEFLVPGIVAMSILFTSLFSGIEIIWDRQFGFLKEILVAPVSRFDIMIGRTFGGATVAIFQGLLVFLISLFLGFHTGSVGLFAMALLFMILIALFFTALGTAIASILNDMQGFQLIMNFIVMPVFFLSGAIFPVDSLPKALEVAVRLNPLSYGIDGLRGALAGTFQFGLTIDLTVLGIATIVVLSIGSYLFSRIQV